MMVLPFKIQILKAYGANAWKVHNEELNRIKNRLKEEIAEERLAIGRLNAARKKEQVY